MINLNTAKFRKAEVVFAIFSLIAIAEKFKGFAGASILLINSLSTLAVYYFFVVSNSAQPLFNSAKLNFASKIGGWSLAIACIGIVYRMNFWNGDQSMLYVGIIGVTISLFYFLINPGTNDEEIKNSNRFKIRLVVAFAMLIPFLVVTKKELFEYIYKDDQEYIRLYEQMIDNPKNIEYKNAFDSYIHNKNKNTK